MRKEVLTARDFEIWKKAYTEKQTLPKQEHFKKFNITQETKPPETTYISNLQFDILSTVLDMNNGGKSIYRYFLNQKHAWRHFYKKFLLLVEMGLIEEVEVGKKKSKRKKRVKYKISGNGIKIIKQWNKFYRGIK